MIRRQEEKSAKGAPPDLPYGAENTPSGFSNTCSTRYRFTGYERDLETAGGTSAGNDYAFARYYNSRVGRFMSADPLDGRVDDPQTLNHYSYVRDNPLNLTDPQGLCFTNTFEDEGPDLCADLWNLLFGGGGGGGFPLNCQFSPACLKGWRANINKQPKKAPKPQTSTIGPNNNYEGSKKQLCDTQSDLAFWENILPFGKTLLGGNFSPGTVTGAVVTYEAGQALDYAAQSPRILRSVRSSPLGAPMTVTSRFLTAVSVVLTVKGAYDALEASKEAYQACMAN